MRDVHVVEQLSEFLDDELSEEENQRVSVHLESCSSCRAVFQDLSFLSTSIHKEWVTYDASDDLTERIFADIQQSENMFSKSRWIFGFVLGTLMSVLAVFTWFFSQLGLLEGRVIYLFMHVVSESLSVLPSLVLENTVLFGEILLISAVLITLSIWSLNKLLRNFAVSG
ncbi:anti-sigma factor family protein [Aneurinibacillus tyrosinisolvens]|uniref:anti-sigma factor family protein n=1 Tax=Aneurinibacillus tyrosinisolvens TaxID=1443435 RepID=UPI00063F96D7|nr:zf-HC2 domain-containing protein [Aneurinibacillus tyrosinisolvens]